MADEALKCFTTLLESIPGWIADLEETLQKAAERQKEMLFENQPAQDDQPIDSCHDPPQQPSKSSSVRSKRSIVDRIVNPKPKTVEEAAPVVMQLPHMTQSDELRLAQRKRKTASVCSGREEGPHKYRSRSMVIIYYDGDTQQRFERMVLAISTSRNCLRKAKTSVRMEQIMSQAGPPKKGDDSDSDDLVEIPSMVLRSARAKRNAATSARNDETLAFERVDGCLEKAQMMCERAAHQILRDGDCALEIKHAQDYFADARELGEAELPIWRMRAGEAAEKARCREERETTRKPILRTEASSSEERLLSSKDLPSSPPSLEVDSESDVDSDGDEEPELAALDGLYSRGPYLREAGLTVR
ncbi:hypothetical protein LTR09_005412 [Extremus antarcticus]|uniref:Uncharacterized protein n=1 Tax=Extremus antarcticus TaxID=702011 RepID=A0AAJ0GDQ6_9PEZI|nr:hypothetical protein LTR09_005412 [Extremus antarcticus]